MVTRSELRARARATLGGLFQTNWLLVIAATLVTSAILSVSSFTLVGPLILGGPLIVGLYGFLLAMVRNKDNTPEFGTVFSGFTKGFADNLLTYLLMMVFTALWSLLFVIPGIVKYISYSMAPFIRNDHPEYTATQAIDESRRMMDGHKMEYFLLQLSFIGWMIVGSLCCGIGTLWVSAYMYTANAHFYNQLKAAEEPIVLETPAPDMQ